jgi:hypothetical protein
MTRLVTVVTQKLCGVILFMWRWLPSMLVPIMVPTLIIVTRRVVAVRIGIRVAVLILKIFAIRLQNRWCGFLSVVV